MGSEKCFLFLHQNVLGVHDTCDLLLGGSSIKCQQCMFLSRNLKKVPQIMNNSTVEMECKQIFSLVSSCCFPFELFYYSLGCKILCAPIVIVQCLTMTSRVNELIMKIKLMVFAWC